MPHKGHTRKALRQDKKRRLSNRQNKSAMRTAIKQVRTATEQGNTEDAQAALKPAISVINRTARKGSIHKRKAARLQSRLTRSVNKLAKSK